ncbi:MAG: hypothetical protein U1E17_01615 [Geminicoccaceae bacterium]
MEGANARSAAQILVARLLAAQVLAAPVLAGPACGSSRPRLRLISGLWLTSAS